MTRNLVRIMLPVLMRIITTHVDVKRGFQAINVRYVANEAQVSMVAH